jgi:Fur family transcriptional regulator, zinc uptake regulator
MSTVFHDHDHAACTDRLIERAESVCADRGVGKLTPLRRRALEVLAESHRPMGAYELIDRLAEAGSRPAPTTVYRTLDFLIGQGLVHRIESRNAFVACSDAHSHQSVVVFLLCQRCGTAAEADAADVAGSLAHLAAAAGFAPAGQIVELQGICAACGTAGA